MTARGAEEHLREEEMMGLVLDDLPDTVRRELDEHVERCERCAIALERCHEAQADFPAGLWEARRPAMAQELRADFRALMEEERTLEESFGSFLGQKAARLLGLWARFLGPPGERAAGAAGREPAFAGGRELAYAAGDDGEPPVVVEESDEHRFGLTAEIDPETKALTIRVHSTVLELTGWRVRIGDERWFREEPLVADENAKKVGAKFVIPPSEREGIPHGTQLLLAVLRSAPAGE